MQRNMVQKKLDSFVGKRIRTFKLMDVGGGYDELTITTSDGSFKIRVSEGSKYGRLSFKF